MTSKDYYKSYLAGDQVWELNQRLVAEILSFSPERVYEFGCGSGKNLKLIQEVDLKIMTCGSDISAENCNHARLKSEVPLVIVGDEGILAHLCNFDVVFTCSVMDHIEENHFTPIIEQFKRIANKAVILAETNDKVGEYFFPHDYKKEGFEVVDYAWESPYGGLYRIWIWRKILRNCE